MCITFFLQLTEPFNPCGGLHPTTCSKTMSMTMITIYHHDYGNNDEDDDLAMKKTAVKKDDSDDDYICDDYDNNVITKIMTTMMTMIEMTFAMIPPAPAPDSFPSIVLKNCQNLLILN